MRIEDFRRESRGDRSEVRARVVWEESNRPPLDLRFETNASPDGLSSIGGNPFLVACAYSARYRGERRIRVDDSLCPFLHDGVRSAMGLLSDWYGGSPGAAIEPAGGWRPFPARAPRAGLFFSGGVDSLHLLLTNRRIFSARHTSSFRDAVYLPHYSFTDPSPSERAIDVASRQRRAIDSLAKRVGLEVVIVEGNADLVEPDFDFHVFQCHGAVLIAAGHALAGRLGFLSIAATFAAPRVFHPYGSHPLLDSLYSSSGLALSHEGIGYDRLEKVREIASWEPARDTLMVCFEGPLPDGRLNCGRCEKCVRTMTGLFIAGALDRFPVFGKASLNVDAIRRMPVGYHPHAFSCYWEPMARALEEQGQRDLSRAVSNKIQEARDLDAWISERDWKGRIRRFDRRFLGSRIASAARRWRGIPPTGGG